MEQYIGEQDVADGVTPIDSHMRINIRVAQHHGWCDAIDARGWVSEFSYILRRVCSTTSTKIIRNLGPRCEDFSRQLWKKCRPIVAVARGWGGLRRGHEQISGKRSCERKKR